MVISKKIAYGTLDIDPEEGKLWFNCPLCLIRMENLNFKTIHEKFTMLDFKGADVYMIPGKLEASDYSEFLESLTDLILPQLFTLNDIKRKDFLDKILFVIKGEINNEQ
jgi:hypothetical protein